MILRIYLGLGRFDFVAIIGYVLVGITAIRGSLPLGDLAFWGIVLESYNLCNLNKLKKQIKRCNGCT